MMKRPKGTQTEANESREDIVFGISPVIELLRSRSRRVEKVLIADGKRHNRIEEVIGLARSLKVRFQFVPRSVIAGGLSPADNHQGVVAVCSAAEYYDAELLIEELSAAESTLCLILDGIEDPQNLGAILRSAECAGVSGVFIPERRSAGLSETVARTSAGALEFVKVAKVTNINRLIDRLKEAGLWIVGATEDADAEYHSWDWNRKSALVMGNEGSGINRLTTEKCDSLVRIPMYGRIGSLNVSVAAGVVLFEARRQMAPCDREAGRS